MLPPISSIFTPSARTQPPCAVCCRRETSACCCGRQGPQPPASSGDALPLPPRWPCITNPFCSHGTCGHRIIIRQTEPCSPCSPVAKSIFCSCATDIVTVATAATACALSFSVWVEQPKHIAALSLAVGRLRAPAFVTRCFTRAAPADGRPPQDSIGVAWLLPSTRNFFACGAAEPCDAVAMAMLRLTAAAASRPEGEGEGAAAPSSDGAGTSCHRNDHSGVSVVAGTADTNDPDVAVMKRTTVATEADDSCDAVTAVATRVRCGCETCRVAALEFPHYTLARPVSGVVALTEAALRAGATLHALALPWCSDPLPDALLDAMGHEWGCSLRRLGFSHPALARLPERPENSATSRGGPTCAAATACVPVVAPAAAAAVRFLRACRWLESLKVRSSVDWPALLPLLVDAAPASASGRLGPEVSRSREGTAASPPGQPIHADPCRVLGATLERPPCFTSSLRRLSIRHLYIPIRPVDIRAIAQHLPHLRELELTVSSFGGDPASARMGVTDRAAVVTPEGQAARDGEWAGAFEPLLQRLVSLETCSQCSSVFRALAAAAAPALRPVAASASQCSGGGASGESQNAFQNDTGSSPSTLPLRVLVLNAAVLRPFTDVAAEGLAALGPRVPDLEELRVMAVSAAAVLRVQAFPSLVSLSVRLVPDLTDADVVQLLRGLPLLRMLRLGATARVTFDPAAFFPTANSHHNPIVVAQCLRRVFLPQRVEENLALLQPSVFPRLRHVYFH